MNKILNLIFLFIPCLIMGQSSTITLWKDSVMGTIYNKKTNTVAYGRKDKNGIYKIYLSDTLGNNEKPLSYKGWNNNRQQFAEEWTPAGDYLFCYVEKDEYVKEKHHRRKPVDAIPGYGAYTDLWMASRDGSKAWKLVEVPNNYNSGIIHSAISNDGTLFAWTERIKAPRFGNFNLMAGSYVIKVADFVFDSVPRLINIRTFQPGSVDACNELAGISNDKTCIAFYSTFETKNLFTTPIYTINILTGETKRLTWESFAQMPTYTPEGRRLVYMTGADCDIFPLQVQGADWWIMNSDGSGKQRLTFMNKKDDPQSVNHYRLAGCISFISNTSFFGNVMTKPLGLTGYTVKVNFSMLTIENEKK